MTDDNKYAVNNMYIWYNMFYLAAALGRYFLTKRMEDKNKKGNKYEGEKKKKSYVWKKKRGIHNFLKYMKLTLLLSTGENFDFSLSETGVGLKIR